MPTNAYQWKADVSKSIKYIHLCFAISPRARSPGIAAAGRRSCSPLVAAVVLTVGYNAAHGRRHWRAAELKNAALS
jgi:hypothetical protein